MTTIPATDPVLAEPAAPLDPAYERYLVDLDSLDLFRFAEKSQASRQGFARGTGWMKAPDADTGRLLALLGKLAMRLPLMPVALAVARGCNPHASRAEWGAAIFIAAREALAAGFDDVERRSGPEAYRLSECRRPYTRREKLLTLETLRTLMDSHTGLGWCAERCAKDLDCLAELRAFTGEAK